MITHLQPDNLECEVKWALGSITMNRATGGDGIPVELFQILKDELPRSVGANMLLKISEEKTPERMKGWSQNKNNTQLWI